MNAKIHTLTLAVAFVAAGHVAAAVTPEEAAQLGDTLTPWGAIQAGNEAGTIPAYTGTVEPPANFDPSNPGFRPDPFADEEPLFSITADNMTEHADKLSVGVKTMLEKYPTFRLDIYPSHRTANYPDWVNENSIQNATQCKSINNSMAVEGCFGGIPFPIPQNGAEVMWNKLLQFEAPSTYGKARSWLVDNSGRSVMQGDVELDAEYPYYNRDKGEMGPTDNYWIFKETTHGPARKAGEIIMLHDSLDMVNTGRRAWQYIPGQRRVKLSPNLAYDTPNPSGGGTSNMDDPGLFMGAMDRFDWKLLGREEKYIPYNVFKLKDPNQCSHDVVLTKSHFNPDCVRWELHRVWVVEATLKEGVRHNYHRRVFYLDEDVFSGLADNFDAADQLYRTSQSFSIPRYEAEGHDARMSVIYDLSSGAYASFSFTTDSGGSITVPHRPSRFWSPDSLAGSGIR